MSRRVRDAIQSEFSTPYSALHVTRLTRSQSCSSALRPHQRPFLKLPHRALCRITSARNINLSARRQPADCPYPLEIVNQDYVHDLQDSSSKLQEPLAPFVFQSLSERDMDPRSAAGNGIDPASFPTHSGRRESPVKMDTTRDRPASPCGPSAGPGNGISYDYEYLYTGPTPIPSPAPDPLAGWNYSPLYGNVNTWSPCPSPFTAPYPNFYPTNPPMASDPCWNNAPNAVPYFRPYKSYSMDRIHTITPNMVQHTCRPNFNPYVVQTHPNQPPMVMMMTTSNLSPAHTPSSSPILARTTRFSPSPGSSPAMTPRNPAHGARRVLPPPPVAGGGPVPSNHPPGSPQLARNAAGKPPRPRPRPPLQKAKTIDSPYPSIAEDIQNGDSTGYYQQQRWPPASRSKETSPVLGIPGGRASPVNPGSRDMNLSQASKVPSLDSLYEQLKTLAQSPGANNRGGHVVDPALAVAAAAAFFGVRERERASTFSGTPTLSNRYPEPHRTKPEVEERLQRLEGDKDSLQMQVSVLMDQIDAQTEKISELEKTLTEKSGQLGRAEDMLQKELLSRSSAETHKLELISEISNIKLRYAALERENLELRGQLKRSEQDMLNLVGQEMLDTLRQGAKPIATAKLPTSPVVCPDYSSKSTVSLPVSSSVASLQSNRTVPSPAPASPNKASEPRLPYIQASKTPPASTFRKIEPFNSLPRQREAWTGTSASPSVQEMVSPSAVTSTPSRKGVAFGKSLFQQFRGPSSRSCSAPNLAETERRILEQSNGDATGEDISLSRSPLSPTTSNTSNLSVTQQLNKPKGIKKIFGRLKRSNSGSLEDTSPEAEFKRGGVRATAGPRLIINEDTRPFNEPELPFAKWEKDAVCAWLHDIGLHMYVSEAARWVKNGEHLLKATSSDLEKDLGVKHPLHKKKLVLALEERGRVRGDHYGEALNGQTDSAVEEAASRLDHQWVVRWLDDVGLPQYKDAFLEARVDGRVLHNLTVEDLCQHLKVTNLLHVTSLKRGIQVLRIHKYQPNCLTRRSLPEDQSGAHVVELWTNHRVMEWLRVVDLSEYAPNMRGSGVHGALMVYEPRFTAELLATILSIPVGKTLLRRHLATHFHDLLGRFVVQQKRDAEAQSGYVPLTPIAKVKLTKRSQFTLKRKKSKSELDFEDLVCPLETSQMGADKEGTPYEGVKKNIEMYQ